MKTVVIGISNGDGIDEIRLPYDPMKDEVRLTTKDGKVTVFSIPNLMYIDVSKIFYIYKI